MAKRRGGKRRRRAAKGPQSPKDDKLLLDGDDLVQKGYGWMLKEASKQHQQQVFDYVIKNRSVMPRTALRYAIEKMPQDLREEAMKK